MEAAEESEGGGGDQTLHLYQRWTHYSGGSTNSCSLHPIWNPCCIHILQYEDKMWEASSLEWTFNSSFLAFKDHIKNESQILLSWNHRLTSDSSSIFCPSTCRRFKRVPGFIAAENFSEEETKNDEEKGSTQQAFPLFLILVIPAPVLTLCKHAGQHHAATFWPRQGSYFFKNYEQGTSWAVVVLKDLPPGAHQAGCCSPRKNGHIPPTCLPHFPPPPISSFCFFVHLGRATPAALLGNKAGRRFHSQARQAGGWLNQHCQPAQSWQLQQPWVAVSRGAQSRAGRLKMLPQLLRTVVPLGPPPPGIPLILGTSCLSKLQPRKGDQEEWRALFFLYEHYSSLVSWCMPAIHACKGC